MEKKRAYLTPLAETIDQVSMNSPLCVSGIDILTEGGDAGNGLTDYEYVAW